MGKDSDNPGYFYVSTKEEDGGKALDMEPLRINGFKSNTSGVLMREGTDVLVEDDESARDTVTARLRDMLT